MKRTLLLFWTTSVSLSLMASQGQAQSKKDAEQTAEVLNSLYGNYAPADLSAPSLLDVDAEQVSKPSSVKNVTGDLIQSFEGFKGVGVEVAPVMFFRTSVDSTAPKMLAKSIAEYRKAARWRGITLSGASVSNDTTSRVAAGLGWVFHDGTDPLLAKGYAEALAAGLLERMKTNDADRIRGEFAAAQNREIDVVVTKAVGSSTGSNHDAVYNTLTDVVFKFPNLRGSTTPSFDEAAKRREEDKELEELVKSGKLTTDQRRNIQRELEPIRLAYATAYTLYATAADKLINSVAEDIKDAREAFEKRKWNATVIQAGAGQVWQSPDKKWGTLRKQSFGVFARAAIRPSFLGQHLSKHGLVILNAQYKWASDDTLKSSLSLGARFSYGNYKFRMAIQSSWQNRQFQETSTDKTVSADQWYWTLSTGPEFRISDNLWVQLAFGASSLNKSASLLTLANVKYSFRKTDAFTTAK